MDFFRQLSKTERTLIIAAILCLLVSSMLLFDDDWLQHTTRGNRPEIGMIINQQNDTRFKSNGDLTWYKTGSTQKVSIGDSVFAGENSKAEVRLTNGGEITINENSMVLFAEIKDQKMANLVEGTFQVKVNGAVKVAINGKMTTIEGHNSELKLEIRKGHAPKLSLVKGDAKLKTADQKVITLQQDTPIESAELSSAEPEEAVAELPPLPPPPPEVPSQLQAEHEFIYTWHFYDWYKNKTFTVEPRPSPSADVDLHVPLAWKKAATAKPTIVQWSRTPDFTQATSMQAAEQSFNLESAQIGENYWRISFDGTNWSPAEKFTVKPRFLDRGEPSAKIGKHRIVLTKDVAKVSVHLSSRYNARGFVVQASTAKDFNSRDSHAFWSDEAKFNLSFYHPGIYYYRFRTVSQNQELSDWSKTETFQVLAPLPPAREVKPLAKVRKAKEPEPKKVAEQEPERKPAETESTNRLRMDLPITNANEVYKSSLFSIEGLLWTIQSTQQYYDGASAPIASGVGVRATHWWNNFGVDASGKTGLMGLNGTGREQTSLKDFEGVLLYRFYTPFPFSLSRELQISLFGGYEMYRNTADMFSNEYNLMKFGTSLEFPVASHWSTGGLFGYGYGLDASTMIEVSGHLIYYLNPKWSLGGGYRLYLFQAGSASAAGDGQLPYREGYTEGYSVLEYHY